tara:strand:+ start:1182 stop:2234 length:1053 start_codon:yes stop_codon:yes gene_type:complete
MSNDEADIARLNKAKAYNGLNFIKMFKDAFDGSGNRPSIEHMETLLFIGATYNPNGTTTVVFSEDKQELDSYGLLELRHIEKQLAYPQAKMHRTAGQLQNLGYVEIKQSLDDARQKTISLTEKGMSFYKSLTDCMSDVVNDSIYETKTDEINMHLALEYSQKRTLKEMEQDEDSMRPDWVDVKLSLKAIIFGQFQTEPEVGANYVKVSPNKYYKGGIITFPVLLKRTRSADFNELVGKMMQMETVELALLLTPTPKTAWKISEDAQAELNSMYDKFGIAVIERTPQLHQRYGVLLAQLAKEAEIKLKMNQGIGSLNRRIGYDKDGRYVGALSSEAVMHPDFINTSKDNDE